MGIEESELGESHPAGMNYTLTRKGRQEKRAGKRVFGREESERVESDNETTKIERCLKRDGEGERAPSWGTRPWSRRCGQGADEEHGDAASRT